MMRAPVRQLVVAALLVLVTGVPVAAAPAISDKPVEPVHFTKLLSLLPDKVPGAVADDPDGSSTSAAGFKLSEVSRVYHKGDAGSAVTVRIRITDGTGNAFFAAANAPAGAYRTPTADGYETGFMLDGYPAVESYAATDRRGALRVFVAGRFLVEIDTTGLDAAALRAWWERIDVKKLTALSRD